MKKWTIAGLATAVVAVVVRLAVVQVTAAGAVCAKKNLPTPGAISFAKQRGHLRWRRARS